ncbi:MAG: methyl-accepting chemotaxis protein [Deltaproteobacteria bacterium]|nr:methyl-accepting chemotaxis protein [Deltaproteobacteria bacterium]
MASIRTRLLVLTVGAAAALVLTGGFAVLRFGALDDDLEATEVKVAALHSQGDMDMMHDALRADVLSALVANTPEQVAAARHDIDDHAARFRRETDALARYDLSSETRAAIASLQPKLAAYVTAAERLVEAAATDKSRAFALRPAFDASFKELEGANEQLGEQIEHMGGDISAAQSAAARARLILLLLVVAAGGAIIFGGSLVGRRIVKSVNQTAGVLHAVATGDMTQRVEVDDGTEIGQMMGSLNTSLDQIETMLGEIRSSARDLSATAGPMGQAVEEIARNSERSSAQSSSAATASTQSSGNIQTVAAATEEMAATIRDVARNAQQAARVAGTAVAVARHTNESVTRLGASSVEIGAVVDVITQIAEQTNLLALNATIEAARAGVAGRGFAVVATEIKELAKQTAKATEEIRGKIAGIQRDTGEAVKDIAQVGEVIGQIDAIQNSIAAAVEQQAAVTSDIGRNISEIAASADTIARDIQSANQAARDNASLAERSTGAVRELTSVAARLERAVATFRLRNGGVPRMTPSGRIEVIVADGSTHGRNGYSNGNGHSNGNGYSYTKPTILS